MSCGNHGKEKGSPTQLESFLYKHCQRTSTIFAFNKCSHLMLYKSQVKISLIGSYIKEVAPTLHRKLFQLVIQFIGGIEVDRFERVQPYREKTSHQTKKFETFKGKFLYILQLNRESNSQACSCY